MASALAWKVKASQESTDFQSNSGGGCGSHQSPASLDGWSELENCGSLGSLPCDTELIISANGKSVKANKVDCGGGSPFQPVIGLYPRVTSALGLSGGEYDVVIQRADGKPLNVVSGAASPASPVTGGLAGAGGTGTTGSQAAKTVFQVGDVSNPHEDYWTAINRLSQDRYWYLFSDAESLYLADGTHLMKQDPVLTLDRLDERVNHLEFVWDNTAFNYASSHKKHGKIQHKSHTAKVSSPVEATLNVICRIDEFRAGDVISLMGCGPGDGKWLIGDAKRSVFSTMSELTLVPAVAPLTEQQVAGAGANQGGPAATGSGVKGGFTNPAPGATWLRLDQGFDGNYGPAGAIAYTTGTLHVPGISGWPGQGVYFYIVADNQNVPNYQQAMYYAEGATPTVANGTHVNVGQKVGNPVAAGGTGAPGNFEIGPANPSTGTQLTSSVGDPRGMVLAFYNWMRQLGAGASPDTSSAGHA